MEPTAIFDIPITYDGGEAALAKMDLHALGGSLQGIARLLSVTSNFAVTGGFAKQLGAHEVRVYAREPRAKCFEISTIIEFAQQHQILSGSAGVLFTTLVGYVVARGSNNREEMKLLNARLEQAIGEMGNRDLTVIDRMMATIEKMAESLRPALRAAAHPVGEACDTLSIGQRTDPSRVTIDRAARDAIFSGGEITLTPTRDWRVVFTEMDKENCTGKIRLADEDSDARIRAEISDPAFKLPRNRYLHSFEHDAEISVKAKAAMRDGEIDRLYISDAL